MIKSKTVVQHELKYIIEYLKYSGPIFIRMTSRIDINDRNDPSIMEATILS